MLGSTDVLAVLAGLFLCGAGCATVPPPPDLAAPIERKVPELPSVPAAPAAGRGLVILDSVSGPASATRVVGPSRSTLPEGARGGGARAEGQTSALLCPATPCAAYVPYGTQEVLLESNEDPHRKAAYLLDVTDRPLVLRASLDANVPAGRGRVPGAVLIGAGLGCLTLGGVMLENQEGASSSQALDVVGWAAVGVGVAAAVLGGVLWSTSAPVRYEGRAVQWTPEPGVLPGAQPTSAATSSATRESAGASFE